MKAGRVAGNVIAAIDRLNGCAASWAQRYALQIEASMDCAA
jgi:hypothetical protein